MTRRRNVNESDGGAGGPKTAGSEDQTDSGDRSVGREACEIKKPADCSSFCVIKENLSTILLGVCLRALAYLFFASDLSRRPEWTTGIVSARRLRDGIAMRRDGVDPYTGHSFHVLPMYLLIFDRVFDIENEWLIVGLHLGIDVITGLLLSASAWHFALERGESSDAAALARKVAKCYLLNPLSIGSCAVLNLTTIYNCVLSAVVFFFCKGYVLMSTSFLCVSVVSQIYPLTLVASMFLRFPSSKQRITMFAVLLVGVSVLFALNFVVSGFKWDFLDDTYLFTLRIDDLTPNCGLYWYFFTQVFEHFRSFYLCVFQANAFVYILPLTFSLRNDPHLHLVVSLLLLSVFSAYPTLADAAVYLALLPLLTKYFKLLRYTLVIACTCISCVCLMPVMWHMWVVSGSGNANFYFAVTLLYNVSQVFVMTDLLFAYFRFEGEKHYPDVVNDKTNFVLH